MLFKSLVKLTADRLAQLVQYLTTVREVVGSNPGSLNNKEESAA